MVEGWMVRREGGRERRLREYGNRKGWEVRREGKEEVK